MAAEAVTSVVTKGIISKLISLVADEIDLAWGLKGQLRKFRKTLVGIQNVLQEAELRQEKSKNVKDWLMRLKEVAYEADDILDEYATEVLRRKIEIGNNMKKKVCNFLSPWSNPVAFRLKMAHKIRNINAQLGEINKEREVFGFRNMTSGSSVDHKERRISNRETTAFLEEELPIVGRDKDKSIIIERLIDSSSQETTVVSVLPIVGMGGLGKTTLAKSVYNDKSIQECFDLTMWVSVPDDFDAKRLARKIIESATKRSCSLDNWDTIVGEIRKMLEGKRYLLVLDDVWKEDDNDEQWSRLLTSCLSGDGVTRGSRILVTTRSEKVASMMGGKPLMHRLKGLSDEDCWSIFKRRAFGGGAVDVGRDKNIIVADDDLV